MVSPAGPRSDGLDHRAAKRQGRQSSRAVVAQTSKPDMDPLCPSNFESALQSEQTGSFGVIACHRPLPLCELHRYHPHHLKCSLFWLSTPAHSKPCVATSAPRTVSAVSSFPKFRARTPARSDLIDAFARKAMNHKSTSRKRVGVHGLSPKGAQYVGPHFTGDLSSVSTFFSNRIRKFLLRNFGGATGVSD